MTVTPESTEQTGSFNWNRLPTPYMGRAADFFHGIQELASKYPQQTAVIASLTFGLLTACGAPAEAQRTAAKQVDNTGGTAPTTLVSPTPEIPSPVPVETQTSVSSTATATGVLPSPTIRQTETITGFLPITFTLPITEVAGIDNSVIVSETNKDSIIEFKTIDFQKDMGPQLNPYIVTHNFRDENGKAVNVSKVADRYDYDLFLKFISNLSANPELSHVTWGINKQAFIGKDNKTGATYTLLSFIDGKEIREVVFKKDKEGKTFITDAYPINVWVEYDGAPTDNVTANETPTAETAQVSSEVKKAMEDAVALLGTGYKVNLYEEVNGKPVVFVNVNTYKGVQEIVGMPLKTENGVITIFTTPSFTKVAQDQFGVPSDVKSIAIDLSSGEARYNQIFSMLGKENVVIILTERGGETDVPQDWRNPVKSNGNVVADSFQIKDANTVISARSNAFEAFGNGTGWGFVGLTNPDSKRFRENAPPEVRAQFLTPEQVTQMGIIDQIQVTLKNMGLTDQQIATFGLFSGKGYKLPESYNIKKDQDYYLGKTDKYPTEETLQVLQTARNFINTGFPMKVSFIR